MDHICAGELYIRDLGCICQEVLNKIIGCKTFFLNRLNANIDVFLDSQGCEPLSLTSLYWKMKKAKIPTFELDVYLGRSKAPCRLILEVVAEKVYQQCLKKMSQTNRYRGCQTGKRFKQRTALICS